VSDSTTAVPPGWYPDQTTPGQLRWWDGTQWTAHVQAPYDPATATVIPKAPAGTKTGTVWIWLIVLLPLLSIGSLFLIDIAGYMQSVMANPTSVSGMLSLYTSPGYLITLVLSFLLYGLSVLFAAFDARELTKRGVQRPFHWAFAFLGGIVYVIGRSVVVKRRTGQGLGPLWGAIAVYAFSLIVSMVWTFMMMQAIMNAMPGYLIT
jgi:hypothetical protein